MTHDVKKFVASCPICQKTKITRHTRAPMQITSVAERPFQRVNIDFQGPISPKSPEGHQYIFVATDDLTKYSIAVPTFNQTAETAAECVIMHIIVKFGFPEEIISDGGPSFMAELFKELTKQLRIKQITTSPYTPRANGNVERRNRSTNEYLRAFTLEKPDAWAELLPLYMFAYNIAVHTTTGFSPFELLFGRRVTLPDTITRKTPIYNYDSYVDIIRRHLHEAWSLARDKIQAKKEYAKQYYDRYLNDVKIKPGDYVRVQNHVKHGKYDTLYSEPMKVKATPSDKTVVVQNGHKTKRVNKDHVKLDKTMAIGGMSYAETALLNLIQVLL